jgi:hypothetical protein
MNRRSLSVDGGAPSPILIAAGGALAFLIAFLFRFLSAEFTNDHFMHVAEGQQVLHGEWPARDYFDFGLPLQAITSAAALLWSGHNVYGEALVTVAFIAAGVAFAFVVSAHLSRSLVMAAGAALVALLSFPRLYNYPKAFFYAFALWTAWRYASRPDVKRLILLGFAVGLAFLYRHDHGLYIGISSIALFGVLFSSQPRAGLIAFAQYAGVVLLVISPFLLMVQLTIGLPWYVSDLVPGAQSSIAPWFNPLPVSVDRSAPWLVINPAAERRFNVRWAETVDAAARASAEQKYKLVRANPEGGATWSYVTEDEGHANIRALVDDPAVADTSGIDRAAGALSVRELWYEWLQRRVPLLRMNVLPGVFARGNALAFFYYATIAVPWIGLAVLLTSWWQGNLSRLEGAGAAMAVTVALIVVQTLVRGSPDSRLPDVTTTVAVTGAWAAARLVRAERTALRRAAVVAISLFWVVTVWAVGTNARAGEALNASRLMVSPSAIVDRFGEMRRRFMQRPIETWTDDERGYRGLTRYAFACSQPDDRLLVTWFEPIIYFYAEREFGGRHPFFDGGWQDSERDQLATVERLQHQRVPIVFVRDEFEVTFRKYFPLIASYVDRNYARALPTASADQIMGYQVWVEQARMPVRIYDRLGLPCFK